MTRQLLQEAFGLNSDSSIDLYKDILQCPKDASNAQLRKAYYKRARDFHPDKNKEESAKLKFQAISFAYNYLKDPERRKDYDAEGIIPDENDMDTTTDTDKPNDWKDYFDLIFGKLTSTKKIDDFELQYKMSVEEEADVLKYYEQFQGDLIKCLEFVMLSQERDVKRWMEDYIQPAIDEGTVSNYEANLKKSMAKIDKKLAREQTKSKAAASQKQTKNKGRSKKRQAKQMKEDDTDEEEDQVEIDEDETESEDSEDDKPKTKKPKTAKPSAAKKAKCTGMPRKRRPVVGGCGPSDALVQAIRGRQGRGGGGGNSSTSNLFASLGARYGVDISNDDNDPLDDAAFEKIQSKFKKNKKQKK